ncbi:MAG: cbb3-type cytochrome c oxidase subunit 3 [Pseudomonadota bacterium]
MVEFYQVIKQLWVVWLLLLFVGAIVWVYLPRNRNKMKDAASIPLKDDDPDDVGQRK